VRKIKHLQLTTGVCVSIAGTSVWRDFSATVELFVCIAVEH